MSKINLNISNHFWANINKLVTSIIASLFISTSWSGTYIDSVSLNKTNNISEVYVKLIHHMLANNTKIRRLELNYNENDTITKVDVFVLYCAGPTAYNYSDTLISLDPAIYPEIFHLEVNLYYDTNTVYYGPNVGLDSHCVYNEYQPEYIESYYLPINEQILTTSEFNFHSNSIKIYPNPTEDILTVEIIKNLSLSNFEIHDSMGRTLIEGEFSTNIDVKNLPPGHYIIRLKNENGFIFKKFIKN